MGTWHRLICVVLLACALQARAEAASPLRIERTATGVSLINDLQVPVAALIEQASRENSTFESVMVPAHGQTLLRSVTSDEAVIRLIEPLSPRVPRSSDVVRCEEHVLNALQPDVVAKQIADPTKTEEARRYLQTVGELASVKARDNLAAINAAVQPAVQQYLKETEGHLAQIESPVAQQVLGQNYEQMFNAVGRITQGLARLAAVQKEKLRILYDAARTLAPVVQAADLAAKAETLQYQRDAAYAVAAAGFAELVRHNMASVTPARAAGAIARACDQPAGVDDWLKAHGDFSDTDVVFGTARFDKGDSQPLLFRRVYETSDWVAHLAWPVEATKASVSFEQRTKPIEVTAGRPSLRQDAENARDAAALIKKRYNENNFRAAGGDTIRTVALP